MPDISDNISMHQTPAGVIETWRLEIKGMSSVLFSQDRASHTDERLLLPCVGRSKMKGNCLLNIMQKLVILVQYKL